MRILYTIIDMVCTFVSNRKMRGAPLSGYVTLTG